MPIGAVRLVPGINVERTATLNEAGYSLSNLGRFRDGLYQKIGGWQKFYGSAVAGIPRAMHAWEDLNQTNRLAVGTTTALAIITQGGVLSTITPQTKLTDGAPNFTTLINTPTVTVVDANISNVTTLDQVYFNTPVSVGGIVLSGLYQIITVAGTHSYTITSRTNAVSTVANGGAVPTFTTTSGSAIVVVTLTLHGLSVGNRVVFPISTAVGGVTVSGSYVITAVPGANTFQIVASTLATSGVTVAMNSTNAELLYYINLGPAPTGTGYGIGGYGTGGYGSGTVPASQTGTAITATDWTLDNWGEILLSCPKGGGIYAWSPVAGSQNTNLVGSGPPFNTGMFVAMPAQIAVAYGSTTTDSLGVEQDPLLVRWSDSLDYTNWVVSSLTQAGSFRIPSGSLVVGGIQGPQQGLIWTDLDLWSMSYLGYPLVFGFNKIGSSCGLVAQHAVAQLGANVYWMGRSNFFRLSGNGVEVIPCTVWDFVFQDLDTSNLAKCRAAANTPFNEMFWYFPSVSGGTGECDRYVKYNIIENAWDYGYLARSAWIDQSVLGAPIGASPSSVIYQHEMTANADGQPINSGFQSGYWMIAEGNEMAFVDWLIPDFKYGLVGGAQSANLMITLYAVDYPGDTPRSYGPYTVTSTSQYVTPRLRGRQMAIRIESNDIGSFWRVGKVRYRFAPDGRY